MGRIWVAMSGGVDSSVAAALLLEQGHEVTGVTMQLWPSSDEDGGCCSVAATRDAKRVCDPLGIPHYTLNFRDAFEREVVAPFADEYACGRTPNPCIACNDRLKFSDLLARVRLQGADALATGHYARVVERDARRWLARGTDAAKDQSYFLYRLTDEQLAHVVFPVGELTKRDVRGFAERFGLPVAAKAESQDTCFEVDGRYDSVVATRAPEAFRSGEIVDLAGRVLGHHQGIARFTVGQRRGLGIGGSGEPLYVVSIDAALGRVVVGPKEALRVTVIRADDRRWRLAEGGTADVTAVVRYRMSPRAALATASSDGSLTVEFREPLEGVAPGQSVVCYREDVVVGGGVIACAS